MGKIRNRAIPIFVAVAACLLLARPAVSQEPARTSAPSGMVAIPEPVPESGRPLQPEPGVAGSPYMCCPPQVPPTCRQCGDVPQVNLAVPPEYWPPPCCDCNPCDPLQTCCPNRDDFFLIPPRNCWYGIADGAAIRRDPRRNIEFTTPGPDDTRAVFSTGDFPNEFAAAGHFLVGHTFGECIQLEGVYTGLRETDYLAAVPNGDAFAQLRYASSLQSGELYLRRKMPMAPERLAVSILCGVRYFGLPEEFDFYPSASAPEHAYVGTDNQMVGPEIGAMFEFSSDNRWWVNFEMKAAVLNNHASYSFVSPNTGEFIHREDHTAFAGDLALMFVYRWSPHFATRLGYQAYFLTGLALAPDNANPDLSILAQIPAQLQHEANEIYHGPLAGIELGW